MKEDNSRRNFLKNISIAGLSGVGLSRLNSLSLIDNFPAGDKKDYRVFLFQGDSITDGNRGRNNDPNHIMDMTARLFKTDVHNSCTVTGFLKINKKAFFDYETLHIKTCPAF